MRLSEELLKEECGIVEEVLVFLHQEADELNSIFTTIISKVRKGMGK